MIDINKCAIRLDINKCAIRLDINNCAIRLLKDFYIMTTGTFVRS